MNVFFFLRFYKTIFAELFSPFVTNQSINPRAECHESCIVLVQAVGIEHIIFCLEPNAKNVIFFMGRFAV